VKVPEDLAGLFKPYNDVRRQGGRGGGEGLGGRMLLFLPLLPCYGLSSGFVFM
jgi:hypothetical protein